MRPTANIFPWLSAVVLSISACGAPGATRMEGRPAPSRPAVVPAEQPADELAVEPLDLEGVLGGRIELALAGTPEQVAAMLLDFDAMTGRRPWAVEYELLASSGSSTRARWRFAGKAGMNPTVVLEFRLDDEAVPARLDFHAAEPAFGLAAFFGTHFLWPHPDRLDATLMSFELYIDSGLPFANATAADIASGLREDARSMRAWMKERVGR